MAKAGYTTVTGAAVALVTATPKTVLAVLAPAQFGVDLLGVKIGFDGITATDKAVLIELVLYTADGTSTAGAVNQVYGRAITAGFAGKYNYSIEPTGPTVLDAWTLTPIGGLALYDLPLGQTYDCAVSQLIGVRCTAPTNAVNARASMKFERC
jgi:hypothetical protein